MQRASCGDSSTHALTHAHCARARRRPGFGMPSPPNTPCGAHHCPSFGSTKVKLQPPSCFTTSKAAAHLGLAGGDCTDASTHAPPRRRCFARHGLAALGFVLARADYVDCLRSITLHNHSTSSCVAHHLGSGQHISMYTWCKIEYCEYS